MIIGRLTRDPEAKKLPSGMTVASFSLAVNQVYKDKNGEKKENSEFVNIVVFGNQADACGQWLKKGQEAYVEGRLQTRSWEADDGQKRYRTEVVADKVQFGFRSEGNGAVKPKTEGLKPGYMSKTAKKEADVQVSDTGIEYPAEEINPDDIPF